MPSRLQHPSPLSTRDLSPASWVPGPPTRIGGWGDYGGKFVIYGPNSFPFGPVFTEIISKYLIWESKLEKTFKF